MKKRFQAEIVTLRKIGTHEDYCAKRKTTKNADETALPIDLSPE